MGDDDDTFGKMWGPIRAMRASLQLPADTRDRFHVSNRLRAQIRRAIATGADAVALGVPYGGWSESVGAVEWFVRAAEDLGAATSWTEQCGSHVRKVLAP